MTSATYVALVTAGLISVLVFPLLAAAFTQPPGHETAITPPSREGADSHGPEA